MRRLGLSGLVIVLVMAVSIDVLGAQPVQPTPADKRPGSVACLVAKAYVKLYGYDAVKEKAVAMGYAVRDLDRCVKPMPRRL